jgi:S1-C subfamily serine protease
VITGSGYVYTNQEVYEAEAVFFARLRMKFGALLLPVPSAVAAKVGRSGGLLVAIVVRGGEAYRADLFEGDVILSVDGQPLQNENNNALFNQLMERRSGRPVDLEIWRHGRVLTRSVGLSFE